MELDHTEAANNQSLDRHLFSDYNNDTFMTFKGPPPPARKKVAEKVKRNNKLAKNKRRAITSSNNNGKAMAYAKPFVALANGLNKPLAFSLENN
jgi:hypothetical protein